MPDEVYDQVIDLANKEKRKKSPMAAMLIEDGLKLIGNEITVTFEGKDVQPTNIKRARSL